MWFPIVSTRALCLDGDAQSTKVTRRSSSPASVRGQNRGRRACAKECKREHTWRSVMAEVTVGSPLWRGCCAAPGDGWCDAVHDLRACLVAPLHPPRLTLVTSLDRVADACTSEAQGATCFGAAGRRTGASEEREESGRKRRREKIANIRLNAVARSGTTLLYRLVATIHCCCFAPPRCCLLLPSSSALSLCPPLRVCEALLAAWVQAM